MDERGSHVSEHGVDACNRPGCRERFQLRFYGDHMAHKGYLHLWDGNAGPQHKAQIAGTGLRTRPLNDAMLE